MSIRGKAGPIRSVTKLAAALRLPDSLLLSVASRGDDLNYRSARAPARRGGRPRLVFSPSKDIRLIQRRIVSTFFKNPRVISWPPFLYGGIHKDSLPPGDRRDHVACAARHCGSKSILKLDIEDFFGNVTFDHVEEIFSQLLGWDAKAAHLAACLTTRDGVLPQGGITSSYLALLCLHDVEPSLVRRLAYKKLTYTRYVDDITISSFSYTQNFDGIRQIVEQQLAAKGFTINASKVEDLTVGLEALSVHGLNVAFAAPVLPKSEVKRVRSVCRQAILDAREAGRRSISYRRRYSRAMGLVNKLARVKSSAHEPLVKRLRDVSPLPSYADFTYATHIAYEMREHYEKKKTTFWYWRRFNRLMDRLNLIKVEDPSWAATLRKYMISHFSPEYKSR
mgnify:CR=1 FL=1